MASPARGVASTRYRFAAAAASLELQEPQNVRPVPFHPRVTGVTPGSTPASAARAVVVFYYK